jgi:hypothetical protein
MAVTRRLAGRVIALCIGAGLAILSGCWAWKVYKDRGHPADPLAPVMSSPKPVEECSQRQARPATWLGCFRGQSCDQALHAKGPGPVLAGHRVQKFPKSGQIPGVKAAVGPGDVEPRDAVKDSGLMKPRVRLLQDVPEDLDLPLQCPKMIG